MICDCGEFINEQSGLCPKCHAEVIKQLAQQQALLDEARDIIENTAWPEGDKAFIFLEKVKILGKEEGKNVASVFKTEPVLQEKQSYQFKACGDNSDLVVP